MTGSRIAKRKKKSVRAQRPQEKAKRAARSASPVLGNDPFVRGAASRGDWSKEAATAVIAHESMPTSVAPLAGGSEPAPTTTLRTRLGALESKVETAAANAASRLGELARQEASGQLAHEVLQSFDGLLPVLREQLGALKALFSKPGEVDAFGMEPGLVTHLLPLLDFIYSSWWRVSLQHLEHVPAQGPLIVVANHGGVLPWDALVLRLALQRNHAACRELRPLLDRDALGPPLVGSLAVRLGAVAASPENALRLLNDGRAIAVFPEGSRNAHRPWAQRYHIDHFGRGGFARLALRTGATIIPCAIVGSEETGTPCARPGWLAERARGLAWVAGVRLPFGLLANFPLPARWTLRFGPPLDAATLGLSAEPSDDLTVTEHNEALALQLTRLTRERLQSMLDEEVALRRSVYL